MPRVNPGNSGGPIINEKETRWSVSPSASSRAPMPTIWDSVSASKRCTISSIRSANWIATASRYSGESCDELISDEEEFCPSCGEKLPEGVFEERQLSPLSEFCEAAIEKMGINPVLARDGNEAWLFHKGSSEIRMFVYDRTYLFAVSPINLLPKKDVEKVLDYMLDTDFYP